MTENVSDEKETDIFCGHICWFIGVFFLLCFTLYYFSILFTKDGVHTVTNEIHIEVEDINDSPPVWTRNRPVFIKEEEKIGTFITQVTATDGDATNPRDIYYEITNSKIFGINSTTGVIFNSARIDFDSLNHTAGLIYEVKLKAREVISTNPLEIGDDPQTTSTSTVIITVNDIDDNFPEFDKKVYTAFIPEDIVTGSNIPGLQMTITDIDSALYHSFDLNVLDHTDEFDIIPDKGKSNAGATLYVKNGDLIDFETGPREYVVRLQSIETGLLPHLEGSASVIIKVTDVNDQTPEFDSDTYYRSVPETSPEGTVVIDLDATDSEAGNFGTAGIVYQLYGSLNNHFVIDENSGVISVGNCATPGVFPCIDADRKNQSFLTVSATDNKGVNGRTRSVQVIIDITDENDNAPKPDDSYTAYIIEGETQPVQPLIIKAVDPDTVGGPLNYVLKGDAKDNSLWRITTTTDSFGDRIGTITATRPVLFSDADDESSAAVNFQVDSEDQKYVTTSDVKIIIIDINNNAPVFSEAVYETDLSEDTVGEVSVYTVTATDGDAPTTGNGVIDFSILSGGLGRLTVKSKRVENGKSVAEIYTTPDARFNYDLNNKYEIILEARDQGTPESKKGKATLIVNIIDTNNNIPQITPSSMYIDVPEDRPRNTRVHDVVVIDPDKTADIYYYMKATRAQNPGGGIVDKTVYNYENLFRIEENTGIVRVNSALNRELTSFIVYELTAVDRGASPAQTGTGALFVTITEVNDQDPVFDLPLYNVTLDEELNINYFVRNLHCSDEDDKIASYSISQVEPRNPVFFSVVDFSGVMTISSRIDYEQIELIKLTAVCIDDGTPPRSGTTSIEVYINNINDNAPEFSRSLYQGSIEETAPGVDIGGTIITTVFATDIDKGDYGIVRYRMADPNYPFQIDEVSGVITVKSGVAFDRENISSYGFQVVAYDSPNTPSVRKSTSVPVYLTIKDINDNCPEFKQVFYEETIPESADTGTDIIDIIATDKDFGVNQLLVYSVQTDSFDPPNGSLYFDIGRKSGRIFTRNILSHKAGVYNFNISATDTEGKLLGVMCTSHVKVQVTVLPSENYAPKWIDPPNADYVIFVLESQYEGMLVYDAKAEDSDEGPGGIVDYFFVEGDESVAATKEFRINRVTGIIRAEIEFDREQIDTYFLTLKAQDQGATKATSLTTLIIRILDVDDNNPEFEMKDGRVVPLVLPNFEMKEEELPPNNQSLGKCAASDADSDHANNRIYYRLLTADDDVRDMVTINQDTCDIYLKKPVDYEKMPQLEFSIYAYNDKADDSVKRYERAVNPSILPVIVRITDKNDNPPEFTESEYFACASYESPFKSSIIDLDAHDLEQSDTELTYSLEGTQEFTIDDITGIVRNSISFSSTPSRVFSFTANAFDGVNSDNTKVNVFVTSSDNQVKFKVRRPNSDVRRVQKEYHDLVISSYANVKYVCVDVKNHIGDDGKISSEESDVYVAGLEWDQISKVYRPISASTLYERIKDERADSPHDFDGLYIDSVSRVDDDKMFLDEEVVLIILIITIILIILAILLLCLACYCIWAKKKKKVRKIKAQRHTVAQSVIETEQKSFQNPVYHNSGYVAYEDEYSTVNKVKSPGPIVPVVIPAPEPQSFSTFQSQDPATDSMEAIPPEIPDHISDIDPDPVFESEILPPEEPETPPEIPERIDEPDPVIETEVMPPEPEQPEPVFETEVMPEDPPTPPPEPDVDDFIETQIYDDDGYEPPLPDPPAEDDIETEIRRDTPPPDPEDAVLGY